MSNLQPCDCDDEGKQDVEQPSLKTIYRELEEINSILSKTEDSLEYAVSGTSKDMKSDAESPINSPNISIGIVVSEINSIRRKVNSTNSLVTQLLGN